ncbi:MAG: hypothetical protein M1404_04780 [Acidobacteria bacterium]|nr:hypothetical protein [Acidobacteriota bacterium]
MKRREFLQVSLASGVPAVIQSPLGAEAGASGGNLAESDQAAIIVGVRAALDNSLYPALRERAYPGHFTIVADGKQYGAETTWPGLDSWQMAGAYLLLGKHREMLDYFDFVQASQRPCSDRDTFYARGNVPFAIFPADKPFTDLDHSTLRGLRYPADVYTYQPRVRPGQPKYSDLRARKWIGLFTHWQEIANPLSVLAPICFVLTGQEIFAATQSEAWLAEKMPALEAAGHYLLTRISSNGLLGGAGFYVESPPRNQWDGVTQCYGIRAFRQLAALGGILGKRDAAAVWDRHADALQARFLQVFWQGDHFAEYVHPEHGVVDSHGLADANWAAIGLEVATDVQIKQLWPALLAQPMFWRGGMPTHLVTRPRTYKRWELSEPVPFDYDSWTNDVAAMGRVWYLEVLACQRMRDHKRLRESVVKVCQRGQKDGGLWYERYHAGAGNTVKPGGARGYCEYPAILVRAVLGNLAVFPECRIFAPSGRGL